jgi:hypothetical protein
LQLRILAQSVRGTHDSSNHNQRYFNQSFRSHMFTFCSTPFFDLTGYSI